MPLGSPRRPFESPDLTTHPSVGNSRIRADSEPIAIVGIGCRFPGGVTDAESFWRLVSGGLDAIGAIPVSRIATDRLFDPRPATPGRMMTRWGGFLDRIEEFDPAFFGISPLEAERMDPQQRLLLETAWEALEDAGQNVTDLQGTRTSVFIGQWLSDFEARLFANPEAVDFYMTTGSGRYAASGRLSYVLGLRGPSLTIDTACSSSLTAVHLAARSIRHGESELALAGGVNVILQPHISIAYSQSRMMASDGRCKFGDASGDGYVRSEGAGVVVLKSLSRALADRDRVYALIRGSALNNDGRSSGSLGTPSQTGQQELLESAYRDAGVDPARVRYIEAHGTGTRAGDPVELGALGAVLGRGRRADEGALVGSVKTNFGHTEGAAGVAGLIKVALALHHDAIPPSLHCRQPNPAIPWTALGFEVPTTQRPWPRGEGPRVAGVSAFGIAGSNAHVVLEEAPALPSPPEDRPGRFAELLALSARSPEALRALADRYAGLLGGSGASLQDICWSAATRRTPLEQRVAFVAHDRMSMVEALRRYAAGEAAPAEGVCHGGARPRVAFVFPGQGAQWTGMARELVAREPVFRAALERCDVAARPYADWSILDQLAMEPDQVGYRLDQIDVIQPVLVALAIAYAELWRSLGIAPDAVVGHSMGEVGAACVAGALDLDQAMRIICRRSALMRRTSGQGAMALVELSFDQARARLAGRESRLSVAGSNSPRSSVLSGDPAAIREVMAELERDQIFCRLVKVDVASHSPQMDPLAQALGSELEGLRPSSTSIPIYSTVLGCAAEAGTFGAEYWAGNLRRPVRFGETISRLIADGVSAFIELGPHPVLLPSIQQTAHLLDRSVVTLASARREEPEQAALLAAVGGLFCAGYAIDWDLVMPAGGRMTALPLYPWQRERHWAAEAEMDAGSRAPRVSAARPDSESLGWLYALRWERADLASAAPAPATPRPAWIIVTAEAERGPALKAALQLAGADATVASPDGLAARLAAGGTVHGIVLLAGEGPEVSHQPLSILQQVLEWGGAVPRLWFVSRGGQAVSSASAERVSVEQGALWGTARVLAEEHPELWGGLADLDPDSDWAEDAGRLARELLHGDGEDQIAFRGGSRFVLRLVPATVERTPAAAPSAWRSDAAYLITGGLGDIGLAVARRMAEQGARRLILLGRTPLPPRAEWSAASPETPTGRRIAAVRALESAGVAVHLAAVDLGDERRLAAFLQGYAAEGWPPIRGVVHAAGVLENKLAATMDRATFDAGLGPKLRGAQALDRLLPDLDLFILFSSTGGFLAQPGQANYAAANAGLDALAHDRHARGLPALSVAWGIWADTGLVKSDAARRNVEELARQGVGSLTVEQGLALFGWLRGSADPSIVVLPIDWAVFHIARAGHDQRLFRRQLAPGGVMPAGVDTGLAGRLESASPAERRQILETAVRETLGRVLKIAPSRLETRRPFGTMGLTSLMALELRNRLESLLGRPLSASIAWNYPTVEALVAFLGGPDTTTSPAPPPVEVSASDAPVAASFVDVASLSDEEAARALRAGR